jgi:hypothetical protein
MSATGIAENPPGAGAPAAGTTADAGLLTDAEIAAALRAALGEGVTDAQVAAAGATLRAAEAARWEPLPPEIHPDVGFHYGFVRCTTSCWLGHQILVEGATFRVFRQRDQPE